LNFIDRGIALGLKGEIDDRNVRDRNTQGHAIQAALASNLDASPAAIVCFDILSLLGESEVTSHVDRLRRRPRRGQKI
jgi:hypothetical protein